MRSFLRRSSRPVVARRSRLFVRALEERAVPATITVTNNNDLSAVDSTVSLREALESINLGADVNPDVVAVGTYGVNDEIIFAGSVVSPITLASGQLTASKAVTITGPGAALLTIQNTAAAGTTSRVLLLTHTTGLVSISGVTVTGGNVTGANSGGGINNSLAGSLTLSNVVVTGNTTAGEGGGINNNSTGKLTLNSSTITLNATTGGNDGGGINNQAGGAVEVLNSTITGNSAGSDGGAIYMNVSATLTVSGSLISGNTATATSGGVYLFGGTGVWQFTNSTVTLNKSGSGVGGGIRHNSGALTITNSTISGNSAGTTGGGINQSGGTITLNGVNILNNTANTSGGGINSASVLNINATTISGNTANTTQGGGLNTSSTVNVTAPAGTPGSTVSNNTAPLGGGWNMSLGTVTVRNSTVASNTATGTSGGGGFNITGGTLNFQNSTLAINQATGAGAVGGGFRRTTGTINLSSALIADNVSTAGGADGHSTVAAGVSITLNNSLIGTNVTATSNITFTGTGQENVAAGLDPAGLQLNGAPAGTPLTIALQPGSLALNAGLNTFGLTTDQRGTGFNRVAGGIPDVGAFELPSLIPSVAAGSLPNVSVAGAPLYTFTVVYSDSQTNIDLLTVVGNNDAITVTGPLGYSQNATYVSNSGAGSSVTVTYTVPAPDNAVAGQFDFSDNGAYTVTMNAGEVFDTDGVPNSVPTGTIGNFTVGIGNVFVVDTAINDETTDSDGKLSLREAILASNASAGLVDTITFDPTVFAGATTIALSVGEFLISDPVVVNGTSAQSLTVTAAASSRHFNIALATAGGAVAISNIRLTGGSVGGHGGSIINGNSALTLTGAVIEDNQTVGAFDGGAIEMSAAAPSLTLNNVVLRNNTVADGDGGGVNVANTASGPVPAVTIVNSLITGNRALGTDGEGGGLYFFQGGTLNVTGSTISGNTAGGGVGGGGLYFFSTTVTFTNSTVSGNTAVTGGGGIGMFSSGPLTLNNSTVANNAAGTSGGGIQRTSTGTITLFSSSVAQNSKGSGTGNDINSTAVTANFSNIGDTVGAGTITGANNQNDANPNLLGLANNGGFTLPDGSTIPTQVPAPGSILFNAGSDSLSLSTDQRGGSFLRSVSGGVDIGAVELLPSAPPAATATLPNVTTAGGTVYTFTVVYIDGQTNIDLTTLGNGNVTVTGPSGYSANATYISDTGAGQSVTVTYTVPAPDNGVAGVFDITDNGSYTVTMNANQVFDTDGTPNAVPAGVLGNFNVAIPNFVVLNDLDSGFGSLRQTIADSNLIPGVDTITFDPTFFSSAKTIKLLTELSISDAVVITGPGAAFATVSGEGAVRVFTVNTPGSGQAVNISGLSIANGSTAGNGGGIFIQDESVTLTNVTVAKNTAGGDGGGIFLSAAAASLTVVGSTIDQNTTLSLTTSSGGGVFVGAASAVSIDRSSVTGNKAGQNGGGVYFFNGGSLVVTNSTVSGNSAATSGTALGGGGLYFYGTASKFDVINSTISGNVANTGLGGGYGGGIILNAFAGPANILNSTIVFNDAGKGGGGIASTAAITLSSSIVAGNTIVSLPAARSDLDFPLGPTNVTGNDNLIGIMDATNNATLTGTSNQTGSLVLPLDPLLAPLALNGAAAGSPLTHALQAGSPAINAGNNSAALSFDQRGPGFNRVVGGTADIGAYEVQAAASKVLSVVINAGTMDLVQRSRVTNLRITFDNPATIADVSKAFLLSRDGGGSVTLSVVLSGGNTVADIIFIGGEVDAPPGNQTPGQQSLVDGKYTLTVAAAEFSNGFDGNMGIGTDFVLNSTSYIGGVTPTPATGIFRNFGDADGDGFVGAADFLAFRLAFLTANDTFDYDGANNVDATVDFLQFRLNFLTSV